jgi:hypothetical protein
MRSSTARRISAAEGIGRAEAGTRTGEERGGGGTREGNRGECGVSAQRSERGEGLSRLPMHARSCWPPVPPLPTPKSQRQPLWHLRDGGWGEEQTVQRLSKCTRSSQLGLHLEDCGASEGGRLPGLLGLPWTSRLPGAAAGVDVCCALARQLQPIQHRARRRAPSGRARLPRAEGGARQAGCSLSTRKGAPCRCSLRGSANALPLLQRSGPAPVRRCVPRSTTRALTRLCI